jgi:molybdate/tungstate transport system substrate-binding protein
MYRLVCGLGTAVLVCLVAGGIDARGHEAAVYAGAPTTVNIYHAGSLTDVTHNALGPGFTAATGYPFVDTGGPSVALAGQIRGGQISPDVYISADAEVIYTLIGAQNSDRARWFLSMAGQKMVIAYSATSRFKADLDAAAAGTRPWTDVIQEPGFVLHRGDPRGDPGGYRCVFVLRLAETYYGLPGFADRVMQGDDNLDQISGTFPDDLNNGKADAYITHRTSALQTNVPYIEPADEINQSNPALASFYGQVSYTNPQGLTFHGTPALYGVTIPVTANNVPGAEAFVRYLLSDVGKAALAARGFLPASVLVGGDPATVPAGLRNLVQGTYPH